MELQEPPVPIAVRHDDAQNGEQWLPKSEEGRPMDPPASILTPEQIDMVKRAFSNPQGELEAIDADTLTKLLVDLRPDVSQEQIDKLMERFDIGLAGEIQKPQVLEAAEAVCGYELEKEQMDKAFRLFDRDGNGFISLDQLKKALQEGENGLSNDELGNFLTHSECKTETCFDFRRFVDQIAFAPLTLKVAPKKKKGKGKKG